MLREIQNNENKEQEKQKNRFILIVLICIICLIITVVVQIVELSNPITTESKNNEQTEIINFNQLFNNKINMQEYSVNSSYKKDLNKEIVYTGYEKIEKNEKKYELSVKIPTINIESNKVNEINKEIIEIFQAKAESIIKSETENEAIYTVEYSSYINSDILSLVIRSTLKEGRNAQRVIVKGYTYNITTGEILTINDLISLKNLDTNNIKSQIRSVVKANIEQNKTLINLGYNIYERNLEDEMYKIENIDNFFYGPNGALYIIFAYGNNRYTSELDVIPIN